MASNTTTKPPSSSKKKRSKDGGVSSDEERWLDALESGKLEEMDDELKKIKPKDPKLMTARQRAMYERGSDKEPPSNETLMSLPSGYKEKIMTAEAIQKAALKSQKRKQQADEKREKDKKKTMERILKKQESKIQKNSNIRPNRNVTHLISLKRTKEITTLSFHPEFPCPIEQKVIQDPPKRPPCVVCGNFKKYSCSKTGAPLCSLRCYKKNISSMII